GASVSSMRHALTGLAIAMGCGGTPHVGEAPKARSGTAGPILGLPGEAMSYQVRLRGIAVARVEVAVGTPAERRGVVIVRAHGHSDGLLSVIADLTYDLTTTLDLEAGRPVEDVEETRIRAIGEEEEHERHPRPLAAP